MKYLVLTSKIKFLSLDLLLDYMITHTVDQFYPTYITPYEFELISCLIIMF